MLIQHIRQATQSMVAEYIETFRTNFIALPASMQSRIAGCYQDVERDKADAKGADITPEQLNGLIQKYIYTSNTFSNPTDISGVALDVSGALASQATYYGPIPIPAGSPITRGMRVTIQTTGASPKRFMGTVADYNSQSGSLRLNNLDVSGVSIADGPAFNARIDVIVFKYDTTTTGPRILDPTRASLELQVETGLSYTSNNSVCVFQTANPSNTFDAIVESYVGSTGVLKLKDIQNVQGTFSASAQYSVRPQQASCLAKLRDVVKQDLASNIFKIYEFTASCTNNPRAGASVTVSGQQATVSFAGAAAAAAAAAAPAPAPAPAPVPVTTVTLNAAADLALLNSTTNLKTILDLYKKYNTTYTQLIRTKLLAPTETAQDTTVPLDLALFEEPKSLTGTYSIPNTLFLQLQRLVNSKMRDFYTGFFYDNVGNSVVPANNTAYYEPAIRGIFDIDSVTGTSEIGADYKMLWSLKATAKEYPNPINPSGTDKYTGQEYAFYLNDKYDRYLENLEKNKELAVKRARAIKMMELFEDYYGRVSEIVVTLSMKLPGKAARDRDRLVVAPNSTRASELDALFAKYQDYLYTNEIMDKYEPVKNDLWSCAKRAIDEQMTYFVTAYNTTDPLPGGGSQVLNEWKRPGVTDTYFTELEANYVSGEIIKEEQRPSVIYQAKETIRENYEAAINRLTEKTVTKKAEAGGSRDTENVKNTANYNANLADIETLQDIFIRIYNAKEILDPFKEANKSLGMIQRTRDAMQVGVVRQRVQEVVEKYKALYEAYVGSRWTDLSNAPVPNISYKVVMPSATNLVANYTTDLITINTAFGVDEATLLEIEQRYISATGYYSTLLTYVKSLGGSLVNACGDMKTAYDTRYNELAGFNRDGTGNNYWDLSGVVEFNAAVEGGYYTSLNFKFITDTERITTFGAIDTLLGSTKNVQRVLDVYYGYLSRWSAYNTELNYVKRVMNAVYAEYEGVHGLLTGRTGTLDMSGVEGWNATTRMWLDLVTMVDNGRLATITKSSKPADGTTIKECINKISEISGFINGALSTSYTALNSLQTSINSFYSANNSNNSESWYNSRFISQKYLDYISAEKDGFTTMTGIGTMVNVGPPWTVKENFFTHYTRPGATFVSGTSDVYRFVREKVMKTFSIAYSVMSQVYSELQAIKPEKKLVFKSNAGVEQDITADISGYKTLDYLLVGGGGGGAGNFATSDNIGGGGGGSGHFIASKDGDKFGVNSATVYDASTKVYDSVKWKAKSGIWNTPNNQITIDKLSSYAIIVGSGGEKGTVVNGDSTNGTPGQKGGDTLIKKNSSTLIQAQGGQGGTVTTYMADSVNEWWTYGGSGANDGGAGAADLLVQNAGGNNFGGSSTSAYTASGGSDCTGGSGGGGIGEGSGGTGAITDIEANATAATDYTGAGGGGGADADGQYPNEASRGGHGYAILILNYGMPPSEEDKNTLNFLTSYTEAFQNQNPMTPQLQQRILTQKLNALRFNAAPQSPTILHSIQSLLAGFTSFFG